MKVITFSYINGELPHGATAVFDCRALPDIDTRRPAAQAILRRALDHAGAGAVVAFGCGFGQQRSVEMARTFLRQLGGRYPVDVEHRALRRRESYEQGEVP